MKAPTPTLRQILVAWADARNNRIPVPIAEKREAIVDLFNDCISHGYTREDITTSFCNEIVSECVPDTYKPESRRQTWIKTTRRAIEGALVEVFEMVKASEPSEELVKERLARKEREAQQIEAGQKAREKSISQMLDEIRPEQKVRETLVPIENEKPIITRDLRVLKDLGFDS